MAGAPDSGRLERAYRYCEWLTSRHYENFPVASWLLPRGMRPHVAAVYAFARAADDFADEEKYQGRSLDLMDRWRSGLKVIASEAKQSNHKNEIASTPVGSRNDGSSLCGHPIFIALSDTVRRYDLSVQWLDDLLTAFSMDVTKRRYADWAELMTYCRYSANPVGRLVLALFGIRDPELQRQSDAICSGLQLANHWQDLRIDLARDMLYIPQDLKQQHGVSEEDLKSLAVRAEPVEARQRFQALMMELVQRARALFDEGEPLVKHLKGGLRLEIKLTLAGGRAILDRIEAADYDVFRHRPTLSTLDKIGLFCRACIR